MFGISAPNRWFSYTFNEDGTLAVTGHGFALAQGTAQVKEDQVRLQASFLDGACAPEQVGTYRWTYDGKVLRFMLIDDPCVDRQASLAGGLTKHVEMPWPPVAIEKLANLGATKSLTILPLIDEAANGSLKYEHGVSYLVKTDDVTILMDVGSNEKSEDPSPLQANMQALGVELKDIDTIVISHQHFDHTGGMKWQFGDTFSLGNEQVDLSGKQAYVPAPMTYPGLKPIEVDRPMVLAKGVAVLGGLPMTSPGFGNEVTIAVNVEGKGVILISGCGHETVPTMVERLRKITDAPLFGIVGGIHYMTSDPAVFQPKVDYLKTLVGMQVVAVSPHDTNVEPLEAIRTAMPEATLDVKVGQLLTLGQQCFYPHIWAYPHAVKISQVRGVTSGRWAANCSVSETSLATVRGLATIRSCVPL